MEPASSDDLDRATRQGTILGVQVDGTRYGKGHYVAPGRGLRVAKGGSAVFASTVALVGLGYYSYGKKLRRRGVGMDGSLKHNLNDNGRYNEYSKRDNKRDDGEDDAVCYIKTAHNKMCSDVASIRDKLKSFRDRVKSSMPAMPAMPEMSGMPAMPAMPLATAAATTTRGALSPRSATYGKLKKKSLVAQLQKRDADLRDQEELIRRLQQKLEYYESKELIVASSSWASSSDASSSYRPRGGSGTTGSLNNSEDDAGAESARGNGSARGSASQGSSIRTAPAPPTPPVYGHDVKFTWDGRQIE